MIMRCRSKDVLDRTQATGAPLITRSGRAPPGKAGLFPDASMRAKILRDNQIFHDHDQMPASQSHKCRECVRTGLAMGQIWLLTLLL